MKQKSWVLLFLVTIILPSAILSVFGLIGLRNERFRLQQQLRNDRLALIESLRSGILDQLDQLEAELKQMVQGSTFLHRDYPEMLNQVQNFMEKHPLSGQFMVVFEDEAPWFPPFRGEGSGFPSHPMAVFSSRQQEQLEKAWELEFSQRDLSGAIAILAELLPELELSPQLQMEVLSYMARLHKKSGEFEKSIDLYGEIIRDAPLHITYPGSYLPLSVRFSMVDCLLETGRKAEAAEETILTFDQILEQHTCLNEDQLKAYISLAKDQFDKIKKGHPDLINSNTLYQTQYDSLVHLCSSCESTWNVIHRLKEECLPVISQELQENKGNPEYVVHLTRKVGKDDYLLMAMFIPSEQPAYPAGYAGIRINEDYLRSQVLPELLHGKNKGNGKELAVYDLNGDLITGQTFPGDNTSVISTVFNQNFPPWRIEANLHQPGPGSLTWLLRSFYFWTLLVLLGILVFGMVIISRIIAHEKEVLQLKEDFVSSVSHEFKTPIASIIALTERLLEGNVKNQARVRDYYAVIANDASSLNHLVTNFLDFSKMEEGKKTYHFEATRMDGWLKDLMMTFETNVSDRSFTFQNMADERHLILRIDHNSMKLAIHNLLDNAVKFSDPGSEIMLQLEKIPGHILIHCVDQGIGIPMAEHSRIFQKFYRGRQTSKMPVTGTGLGLAIVKQVVEAHGGEIRVKSKPGEGSTMTMVLPVDLPKNQISDE